LPSAVRLCSRLRAVGRHAETSPLIGAFRDSGRLSVGGLPDLRQPWHTRSCHLIFRQLINEAHWPPRHATNSFFSPARKSDSTREFRLHELSKNFLSKTNTFKKRIGPKSLTFK
jgi:hypothetical protein